MYLDFSALCEELRLSPKTINKLLKEGNLPPPLIVGKSRRWLASDIEGFLKKQQEAKQPA